MNHPQVGDLSLNRERLRIDGTDGLMLVVYHPDVGTDNAEKLALLASAGLPPAGADRRLRRIGTTADNDSSR